MAEGNNRVLAGQIVEEELWLTVEELCGACAVERERIVELIEYGLLDADLADSERFDGKALWRVRTALRLQRDLGVNAAGASLVVELLERIAALEARAGERLAG